MNNNELYHYGVKGMKWGVRKSTYNSADKYTRKQIRKAYWDTPEGKTIKAAGLGSFLGGPIGAGVASFITGKKTGYFNDVKDWKKMNEGKKLSERYRDKKMIDVEDTVAFEKKGGGFIDISSSKARKKAGKEITAMNKAWDEYFEASKGGKIDNKNTRALKKKSDEARVDLFNKMFSDYELPSGRTPKYTTGDNGDLKLTFE